MSTKTLTHSPTYNSLFSEAPLVEYDADDDGSSSSGTSVSEGGEGVGERGGERFEIIDVNNSSAPVGKKRNSESSPPVHSPGVSPSPLPPILARPMHQSPTAVSPSSSHNQEPLMAEVQSMSVSSVGAGI